MPHSVIVASFPVHAKIPRVIPANAGIQAERGGVTVKNLDSRVRGNDGKSRATTFQALEPQGAFRS
jgi:hypothetical protein